MSTERIESPWYREPWPWFLIAGPAIVVVAAISTAVIAVKTDDGLVADDYYKRGLAINKAIARDERARALGLSATMRLNDARDRVRVLVRSGALPAEALRLTMSHATRAGLDQVVALRMSAPGVYEGTVRIPAEGTWSVRLEDERSTWRLSGRWRTTTAVAALEPAA
jgi:hypothetical protein